MWLPFSIHLPLRQKQDEERLRTTIENSARYAASLGTQKIAMDESIAIASR
jgi:hypothetical protein